MSESHKYQLPAELQAKIPGAPAICLACLHGNARFFKRTPTVLVVYCDHSATAAVVDLQMPRPLWTAYAPFSREEWENMLAGAASDFQALLVARGGN